MIAAAVKGNIRDRFANAAFERIAENFQPFGRIRKVGVRYLTSFTKRYDLSNGLSSATTFAFLSATDILRMQPYTTPDI